MRTSGKQTTIASLILGAALVVSVKGQAGTSAPGVTPAPVPPPIRLALTSLTPDATFEGGADSRMAITPDGVWIANGSTGVVHKIDPKTNTSRVSLAVGKGPCQLGSAFRSLWVAFCDSPRLHRFEPPPDPAATAKPATDKPQADKPAVDKPATDKPGSDKPAQDRKTAGPVAVEIRSAGPVVMATGSIWMITDPAGTLARIDPDTNAAVAEISIPGGAGALAFGMNAIWVTSSSGDTVTRVHAETNVVEEAIKVGKRPLSVAIGEGSVWTMNGGDGTVSRIDAKTNKVTETITTGVVATRGAIVVGEGSVWLSASGTPLTRIDPVANRMAQQFSGPGGGSLAIGLKSLWLAATPTAIWRIDPKRVEATRK
jgi:YVTN family beta-propeller protein